MSPMLEHFKQKGIKVPFLIDPINEYYFQYLKNCSDHKLICITKENCEIAETDEMDKEQQRFGDLKTKFEPICNQSKHILGKDCETVVVSKRFVITPCPRFVNTQALRDSSMLSYMQPKKILELNATHSIIRGITGIIIQREADENDKTPKDMLSMLWNTDLLSSGFSLSNASVFMMRVNRMVAVSLTSPTSPRNCR
jgi:molecular chaperone HtpG